MIQVTVNWQWPELRRRLQTLSKRSRRRGGGIMSPANISMFEFYAARGQTAGFVLMAVLLAVLLHGLSGKQSLYRILFGVSGLFFALLAVAGAFEYLYPRGSTVHSINSIVT